MADENNTSWDYKPGAGDSASVAVENSASGSPASSESLTWAAKEFIEHDRGAGWYVVLLIGMFLIAAVIYLITKDFFAVGAIVTVALIAAVYASHKPKELTYELSSRTIRVGERTYGYNMFKSFSVAHEGVHTSIILEPTKRFYPPMTLYFPPEMEQQIANNIGNHIPMQEHQPSATERLAHRLKF
jgi:hypothetical protein